MDAHKNFAYSLVATAPSPAASGTSLVVTAGQGALFPAVPFNATIWPASSQPSSTNAEIVSVTAISTDTLTIVRAQESSSARTVIVGDQIAATVTAKTLTDIETTFAPLASPTFTGAPLSTTPAANDNSTKIATTAYVDTVSGIAALLNNGSAFRETIKREEATTSTNAIGSGIMYSVAVLLFAGDVITNISLRWGGTGAGTPTHWWFALYDDSATPALLKQTADKTTTAIAAGGKVTLPLSSAQTISTTGIYYFAFMVAATTTPSVGGKTMTSSNFATGIISGQKLLAGTSGTGLTTTAPATIASPTESSSLAYMVGS